MIFKFLVAISSLVFSYFLFEGLGIFWSSSLLFPINAWYFIVAVVAALSSCFSIRRVGALPGTAFFLVFFLCGVLVKPYVMHAFNARVAFSQIEAGLAQAVAECSVGICGEKIIDNVGEQFSESDGSVVMRTEMVREEYGCKIVASIQVGDRNIIPKKIAYLEYVSARKVAATHKSLWVFDRILSSVLVQEENDSKCW